MNRREKRGMKYWIRGMRDAFFESLYSIAQKDKKVILVTADTGAICLDRFRKNLNKQYINVGIAEQNMVGLASGLALSGKTVYVYAISPFVTARCFDQVKIDLCCMDLPVTVVGIGAGFDYSTLGPTHHGTEDIALMRTLPGMTIYSPSDSLSASLFAKISHKHKGPAYIRLDREGLPAVYKKKEDIDANAGFSLLKKGGDLCIISTGRMVYNSLEVSKRLSQKAISASVIDLFRIKPLNAEEILRKIEHNKHIVTIEEHFTTGGIGSAMAEALSSARGAGHFLKSIGIPDKFCRRYGSREYLKCLNKLDTDNLVKVIERWVRG